MHQVWSITQGCLSNYLTISLLPNHLTMLFLTYRVYWSFWSLLIIFLKYILDDIFTGFIVFFCFESGLLWVTPRLIACSRTVTPVSRTNIWKNTTSLTELLLTSSKHREPLYCLCMLGGTWRLPHFYKGKKWPFCILFCHSHMSR